MLFFFFFNDPATTEIYTLSLHALFRSREPLPQPRDRRPHRRDRPAAGPAHRRHEPAALPGLPRAVPGHRRLARDGLAQDRKSTRLNSSHANISYAVFCLKKNKSLALLS